jgi:chloramphenicol 3-O-phosphotransferase
MRQGQNGMRLVFIYGPPASGKLTVARELARLTGFKLFHNHVSIQFVTSLFDFGTKTFNRLTDKYRREMLEEASREGVDTIFTFVYGKPVDNEFVKDIVRRVKRHEGRVFFVRLFCTRRELARRIAKPGRRALGKLTEKKILDDLYRVHDLDSEVPLQSSLSIDTGKNSPRTAARMIIQHYKIQSRNRKSSR